MKHNKNPDILDEIELDYPDGGRTAWSEWRLVALARQTAEGRVGESSKSRAWG